MELFGIILSLPVAFVASLLYCLLLDRLVLKVEGPRPLAPKRFPPHPGSVCR